MAFGPFQTRAETGAPLVPVTAGSLGPVVTGVAGGNFSQIVAAPVNDLDATKILFSRAGVNYIMNTDGSGPEQLSTDVQVFGNGTHPSPSPDGKKFAYMRALDNGSSFQIFTCNIDGSSPTRIDTSGQEDMDPAWSPANNKIAFWRNTNANQQEIFTCGTAGGSPTQLGIVFTRQVLGQGQIFVMNANGSNAHNVTPPSMAGRSSFRPAWSPDGTEILCASTAGNSTSLIVFPLSGADVFIQVVSVSSGILSAPCWSPDGKKIAYMQNVSGSDQIWVANEDGTQAHVISSGSQDDTPGWTPFPQKRTLVGSGGSFSTSAAGFLYGQDGHLTTSVVVFGASDPLSTTVTSETGINQNLHDIIFNIAGSLNSIKYQNGAGLVQTVVPTGSVPTATGALVTFDASDGTVASIIPFSASRAKSAPLVSGDEVVYHGSFLAVYDKSGKNLAPNGATEIHIRNGTGEVISAR
jgi:dipeptidyl aminopeptidase/acylaminoacyl peptidase